MNGEEFKPGFIVSSASLVDFPSATLDEFPSAPFKNPNNVNENGEISSPRKPRLLVKFTKNNIQVDHDNAKAVSTEKSSPVEIRQYNSIASLHINFQEIMEEVNKNNEKVEIVDDDDFFPIVRRDRRATEFQLFDDDVKKYNAEDIRIIKQSAKIKKEDSDSLERIHIATQIKLIRSHPHLLRDISDFEFIQEIGEGGFSKVWKANDLRTGKVVAVKELSTTTLKGKHLLSFIREINTLALTQSRFVIPFVGFTITPPYSLITEYMPHDTLFMHTNRSHRSSALSGTHLSIIALCIAHGMDYIGSKNVIHRDLKALNILIDSEGLPRIIDFGTARILNESSKLSKNLGTLSHMAPEILNTRNYDTKADVYAYGMLLYEMVESHNCFNRKTPTEITQFINNNVRPGFKTANKPMKELIRKCWAQKPKDRPTFKEIVKTFSKGKAYFPGADVSQVVEFAQMLKEEDRKEKLKPPPELPKPFCNIDEVISDLEYRLANKKAAHKPGQAKPRLSYVSETGRDLIFQKPNISTGQEPTIVTLDNSSILQTISEDALSDPTKPEFFEYLDSIKTKLQPENFPSLFKKVFNIIYEAKNMVAVKSILQFFLDIAKANHNFLNTYHECKLYTVLPYSKEEVRGVVFHLLLIFFEFRPNLLNPVYRRITIYYILNDTEASIALLGKFIENVSLSVDPYPIITFFISHAKAYINNPCGVHYIDIFHYMMKEYEQFKKANMPQLRPIFLSFIKSKRTDVSIQAIKAICSLFDDEFQHPYTYLNKILRYNDLSKYVVSLLLRVKVLPLSKTLFSNIVTRALLTPDTFPLVFKFVSTSKKHAEIAVNNLLWMKVVKPETIRSSFQLFLYLFTDLDFKEKMINSNEIYHFLFQVAHLPEIQYYDGLNSILKRIRMSNKFAKKLLETGFLRVFIGQFKINESLSTLTQFILTIDQFVQLTYSEDYIMCLPVFLTLLHERNDLTSGAIAVISAMSRHGKMAKQLATPDLIEYFNQLLDVPQMDSYAKYFLGNVENYIK
ncbi:TKL family protein kinase [Tritrichomonas foetus]|uniref:TKL family protein kinase n=1 Tax=Tritrichomonas foetus TaxID=1144522 RepID=A0A1J4KHX1_9EUKA|nr:TKL family protein kinase [Tritrichomonas foetus]|eukprot:OHT10528.1 TKL family protein kinase [Tritrichomonas foetus]